MRKGRKNLLLYGLVLLLVLALAGAAWAAPTDTNSREKKSVETQPASVFKDVTVGDNNLIYINYLAKREIINGFPDGGFHPNEGLSRAQAATLLVKAAGLSSKEKKVVFKDVYEGHWAAGNIAAAAEAGFLKGYPDGTYHPEEKLSRAQGMSLVLRLSQQKDTGVELPQLKDLDSKHWAARSVAIGLAAGMVGLTTDKTQFLPDDNFSRGDLTRALAVLLTTDPDLSQTALNGSLEIKKGEVKINDKAVTGTVVVKAGDLIATASGGEAQLSYPDGSGLLIKENTKMEVKETRGRAYIKQDGSPGIAVDWLLVDLKKGDVFGALATNPNVKEAKNTEKKTASLGERLLASISGGLEYLAAGEKTAPWYQTAEAKKVKVKVDMPYGVAAIRGSFWNNAVTSTGCSTSALEGDVATGALGGEPVQVPAGQSSSVAQGSAEPTAPAPMTPAQVTGWVQQGNWLQNVAQAIQSNQEAVRTEAAITQAAPTPVPGQPNPQAPVVPQVPVNPVTPPPTPAVPNIMNLVNQALTQAQQNAGFTNIINFNNMPPNPQNFTPPPISNPMGGGGGAQAVDTPSTSGVLSKLVNSPAYLQVNTISVNGSSLSLSGKTYPNNAVSLGGPLVQSSPTTTANASGYFAFSNVSICESCPEDFLMVFQLLGSGWEAGVKAQLSIPNALDNPQLPAQIEVKRGIYTDANTAVLITGKVLPAQNQTVTATELGGSGATWTATVSSTGDFSLDIGNQLPGTQLMVGVSQGESQVAWANTYVYSSQAVAVMGTMPGEGQSYEISGLGSVLVFFDRNVAQGSNFGSISITPASGSSLSGTCSVSGNRLMIDFEGSLSPSQTYTVSLPAGAIVDALNPSIGLPEYSFSFGGGGSGAASIVNIVPFNTPASPTQIYADDPCILPAAVRANMSDGTTSELAVTWNPATVNTATPGTYTFNGTAAGYGGPITFSLLINPIPGASSDTTIFSESFESTLSWSTDGLWNVLDNSGNLKNGAVPKYVTLPYGDVSDGYLPNTPYGSKCLWYGKTSSTNPYEVGNFLNQQIADESDLQGGHSVSAHIGSAITPTITLPSSGTPALSFNSWWEIESIAPAGFDIMTVHILNSSGTELAQLAKINPTSAPFGSAPIAFSSAGKDVPGIWQNYSFPLTPYLGQDIKIKFQFSTGDGNYNGFRGWFIDEVKVLGDAATAGIQSVTATPDPIQYSASPQSVNVAISSSGLDDGSISVKLLKASDSSEVASAPATLSSNAATAILSIPASSPEGNYIIRVSGTGFSSYDSPFLISNWTGLVNDGTATFPGANASSNTDLEGDSNGNVYAAYTNASFCPVVKKLSGSSWSGNLGPQNATGSGYVDLALNSCGDAYLAYRNPSNYQPTVLSMVYGSSTWTDLGTISGDTADNFSLITGSSNSYPYLSNCGTSNSIQNFVYDCGGWASLGALSPVTAGDLSTDWYSYSTTNRLYLAFSQSTAVGSYVYQLDGSWSNLGWIDSGGAIDSSAVSLVVPAGSSATPYVAYRDSSSNVMVKMYSGSSWTPVGSSPGVSTANYVSLAFNGTTPYIIYSDTSLTGTDAGKATVKYWNDSGSIWTILGSAGFSATAVTEPRIKIIGSDVYVIYKDTANNIKVMKRTL